jgi:hypothetical protein
VTQATLKRENRDSEREREEEGIRFLSSSVVSIQLLESLGFAFGDRMRRTLDGAARMTCESIGIKPLGQAGCVVKAESQVSLFGAGANRESEISVADATLPLNGEVGSDLGGSFKLNTPTRESRNELVAGQDQVLILELDDLCLQNLEPDQLSPAVVDFLLQVIEPLPKIEQVSEWLSTSCMPLYFSAKHTAVKWSRAAASRESPKVDSKLPESILKSRPGNSDFKLQGPRLSMKDKLKKNVRKVAVRVFDSLTGRKITRYTLRGEELPRKSQSTVTEALDVSESSGFSRDRDSGPERSTKMFAKSMSSMPSTTSLSSMMQPSISSLADTRTGKDAGSHACSSSGGPEASKILSDPEPSRWPSRGERMLCHQQHMFDRKPHMSAFDLASEEDLEQAVTFRFYDSVEFY